MAHFPCWPYLRGSPSPALWKDADLAHSGLWLPALETMPPLHRGPFIVTSPEGDVLPAQCSCWLLPPSGWPWPSTPTALSPRFTFLGQLWSGYNHPSKVMPPACMCVCVGVCWSVCSILTNSCSRLRGMCAC